MTQPPFNPLGPTVPSSPPPQMPPPQAPQAPFESQAPQAPQAPYPPQGPQAPYPPQAPQAPYPPQQVPYAAPAYVPPAAPKKKKTKLVAIIVAIVVVVAAVGGYLGVKAFLGNKLTPYCQTLNNISGQIDDLSSQLTTASSNADLDQMSDIMGQMISLFDQLRAASPPDTVSPSLDTVYDYLTHTKEFIDSQDITGYMDYVSQHDPVEFAEAAATVDSASREYCLG